MEHVSDDAIPFGLKFGCNNHTKYLLNIDARVGQQILSTSEQPLLEEWTDAENVGGDDAETDDYQT